VAVAIVMRVMLGVAMAVAVTVMIKVAQCVVHQHAWRSMCLCVPSARHSKNWTPGVCAILRLVPSPTPLDPNSLVTLPWAALHCWRLQLG
jgi:hypothetical protein